MSDRPDFQQSQDIANQTLSEVDTAVQTQQAEDINFQEVNNISTVPANGGFEDTFVRAPAGRVNELIAINVLVNDSGGMTTGSHEVFVRSETISVTVLKAESAFDESIEVNANTITSGSIEQVPATPAAQAQTLQGVRIDDTDGLQIEYFNDTDGDQVQPRQYELWFREIKVA